MNAGKPKVWRVSGGFPVGAASPFRVESGTQMKSGPGSVGALWFRGLADYVGVD